MASFNKVVLIGNLTRDPQSKTLPSGTVVTEFGMAVNRKYRTQQGEDREEVTFVDCSAFGKTAETIAQWCQKGKLLFVEGRLKYDTWEDKNGGGKRSKLTVVVENFQFIGPRQDGNAGGGEAAPQQHQPQRSAQQRQPVGAGAGRADSPFDHPAPTLEEADIPF